MPRLVRDVLHLSGFVGLEGVSRIRSIVLNGASVLARHCVKSLRAMLKAEQGKCLFGRNLGA